jgi:lipase ATG15
MKLKYLLDISVVFEFTGVEIKNDFNMNRVLLSKSNIINLGYMANNAYYSDIDKSNWKILPEYNVSKMEPELIMGYVFSDEISKTHIISFKGTNIYPGGKTRELDKFNDNLYFSCCLNITKGKCEKDSYKQSLNLESNYINYGQIIVNNIKKIINFDKGNVIFTGHSLGGAVATYMGILYNKTVVTFQTPGEKRYSKLSGLDKNKSIPNIYHIGHDADPIFNGDCGWWCKIMGYYIETKCHYGKVCRYTTNSTVSIWKHRMSYVISEILEKYDVPNCYSESKSECLECSTIKFSK